MALEHYLCSVWDTICVWVTIFVIFEHYLHSRWDAVCAWVTLFVFPSTIYALAAQFCTLVVTLFVLLQHYLCLGGTICGLGGTPVVFPWIGIGTGLGIGVEGARRSQYARGATL